MLGRIKCFSISVLLSALIGCGGEDVSTNDRDVEDHGVIDNVSVGGKAQMIAAPIAQDQFSKILLSEDPDSNRIISLKEGVSDPQGLPVTLEQVMSLSSDCQNPISINAKELSFVVKVSEPDVCYYQYIVKNNSDEPDLDKTSTANSIVMMSGTEKTIVLSPISAASEVNQQIDIDLEAQLEGEFPGDNYVLDEETLVLGSGDAIANTATNTIITYSANQKGLTTLYYTLTEVDGVDIASGRVEVAVSNTNGGNHPPEALDFSGPQSIDINTEVTVDVAGHISDSDSDVLQLIDVNALNANVKPDTHKITEGYTIEDYMSNTKFTFITEHSGIFDVSYSVYDHRDGYASGVVHITVQATIPWDDITLDSSETYTAPWEKEAADGSDVNINYDDTETETVFVDGKDRSYVIPLFSHSRAQALCGLNNMVLPTEEQLITLFQSFAGAPVQDSDGNHWPVGRNYWSVDETKSVSLSDGSVETGSEGDDAVAIMTCVYPGTLSAEVTSADDDVYALNEGETATDKNYHTVEATVMNAGNEPQKDATVYLYPSSKYSPLAITPSNAQTDENGQAIFKVSSEEVGTFGATVSYLTQTIDVSLEYIADTIASLSISGDKADIPVHETVQLEAYGTNASGDDKPLTGSATWSSSDDTIATVDGGLVYGESLGDVVISASYEGAEDDSRPMLVYDTWGDDGYVEISPQGSVTNPIKLTVGESKDFTAKAYTEAFPTGYDVMIEDEDRETLWMLNSGGEEDHGSLEVTEAGAIFTAESVGVSSVQVSHVLLTHGFDKTDNVMVTIEAAEPVDTFVIEGPTEVAKGEVIHLLALLNGEEQHNNIVDGVNQYDVIGWKSSDTNRATVDTDGYVTGKNNTGDVTITATLKDGSIDVEPATYVVEVTPEPWDHDYIEITPDSVTLDVDGSQEFTATFYNANNREGVDVTDGAAWKLNEPNGDIGYLSKEVGIEADNGNIFNATKAGEGSITVSIQSGITTIGATATIVVNDSTPTLESLIITDGGLENNPMESLTLDLTEEETYQYTAVAVYSDGSSKDVTSATAWSSNGDNASNIASFNPAGETLNTGEIKLIGEGSAIISASYGGMTDDSTLVVTDSTPVLTFVEITNQIADPQHNPIEVGETHQYGAIAHYSNDTFKDVRLAGAWSSNNGNITIDNNGLVTGIFEGSSEVSFDYSEDGVSAAQQRTTIYIKKRTATLTALEIRDTLGYEIGNNDTLTLDLAVDTYQYIATAFYDNGSRRDVTESVKWSSNGENASNIASFKPAGETLNTGEIQLLGEGAVTIKATYEGKTDESILEVVDPVRLTSVEIRDTAGTEILSDGDTTEIEEGSAYQFTVWAMYSNGLDEQIGLGEEGDGEWSVETESIISVDDTGLVTALGSPNDTSELYFDYEGMDRVKTNVKVTEAPAVMTGLEIRGAPESLAIGDDDDLEAWAVYDRGPDVKVTDSVEWGSLNENRMSVGNGEDGQDDKGHIVALSAAGYSAKIKATYGDNEFSDDVTIGITKTLESVEIRDTSGTNDLLGKTTEIEEGSTYQFTAWAIYSDDSEERIGKGEVNDGEWSVDVEERISVDDTGLVTALDKPNTTSWVFFDYTEGGVSKRAKTNVKVIAAPITLTSVEISNTALDGSDHIKVGQPYGYKAKANYSDGSSIDITSNATWTSSNPSVAKFSYQGAEPGVVTGIDVGTTTVTVSYTEDGVKKEDTTPLEVTPEPVTLTSVEITNAVDNIDVDQPYGYKAKANYSDGSSIDITNNATWTSSNPSVAKFSYQGAEPGVVTGIDVGTTTVTVSYTEDGVKKEDTTPLKVINPIPDGTLESVDEKASVGEYIVIRALFINKETGDSSYVYPTFKPTITSGNGVLSQGDNYWVITANSVGEVQVNMEYNGLTTTNTYNFVDDNDTSPSYDIILGMQAFKKDAPPVPGWCQLSGNKTQILLSGTATYLKYKSESGGIKYEDDYYYRPASEQNCLSYHSYNTFVDTMIVTQEQIDKEVRSSGTLKSVLFDYFTANNSISEVIKGADVLVKYKAPIMQRDGGFFACKKEGEATVRFTSKYGSSVYYVDYSCR